MKKNIIAIGKVLLTMYIMTGILLLGLAALLYKMQLTKTAVDVAILVIYVAAGFLGGMLIGKITGNKKYVWGMLTGLSYFVILLIVSLGLHRGIENGIVHMLTTLVLCTAAGTIGGMVS